jgi:hypothetical protein
VSDTTPLTPDRCPLCGEPNACAMAADGGACWCFTTPIAEGVIERIPPDQRGRACVCARCASGADVDTTPSRRSPDISKGQHHVE